jgi:hypothetical protein
VSPVKYELGFYIPEDAILHSDRRDKLSSYKDKTSQSEPNVMFAFMMKLLLTSCASVVWLLRARC